MSNSITDHLTTISRTRIGINNRGNRLSPSDNLIDTASGLGEVFEGYRKDTGRLMSISVELPKGGEQAPSGQEVSVLRVPDSNGVRYFVSTENNQGLDPEVWGVFVPYEDPGKATWLKVEKDDEGKLQPSDAGVLGSMEELRRRIIVGAVVDAIKEQKEPTISERISLLLSDIYTNATNNAHEMVSAGVVDTPTGIQKILADGKTLRLSVPRWTTVDGNPVAVEITKLTDPDGNKYIVSELDVEDRSSTTSNEPKAIRTWGVDTVTGDIVLSVSSSRNEIMEKEYPITYQTLVERALMNLLRGVRTGLKAQESRF